MRYLIGEASKLVGISSETIRYYEREGAIHAIKDEATGYRYYSALDISVLMRVRMYRNCGYSLPEISHMLNGCELGELEECLAQKQQELREQMDWSLRVERQLARMRATLREVPTMLHRCVEAENPHLFRLEFQQRDSITRSTTIRAIAREWINKMPLAFPSAQFLQEDLLAQNDRYSIGLSVYARDAAYLGIGETPLIRHIPVRRCVYTVIEASAGELLSPKLMAPALKYIEENALRLTGDAIGVGVTSLKKDSTHVRYHQIWLPVAPR